MAKAIRIPQTGGSEVLAWEDDAVGGNGAELTLINAGMLWLVHDAQIRRRKRHPRPHRPV